MIMNWFRSARQQVGARWTSVQVEYQGSYSKERLRQLESYMNKTGTGKMLLALLLTPLPCVLLSLAKELPPLVPIEAGVYDSGVFFVRSWVVMLFLGVSTLVQMSHGVPRLNLTNLQIAFVSFLAATTSIGVIFGLCALLVFPLPFGLLVAGPPFVLVIAVCFTYISGPQWRLDPSLLVEVKRQLVVYQCQTTLPFVYPLYIWGFVSVTGFNQIVFVSVLPVIQIVAKNWISRALGDDDDQKPQCVIFVVEVYNALYVSTVLQTGVSWTSSATIMAVDLIQFWVAMIDIFKVFDELKVYMAKIPRDHPIANEDFVQVAARLMNIEDEQPITSDKSIPDSHCKEEGTREARQAFKEKNSHHDGKKRVSILKTTRVVPFNSFTQSKLHLGPKMNSVGVLSQHSPTTKDPPLGLELIFSREERARFIQKSAQVLFITEYLVLVEYVEVMMPLGFCLHQLTLFHMPNGAYYPALSGVSIDQFSSRMLSTLLYSSFEFASFVMLIVVLKRKLGFSSWKQLAFVLDFHAGKVQTKLNLIFVYIMQVSLEHLGADFSFTFAWMRSKNDE